MTTQYKLLTLQEARLLPNFYQYPKNVFMYKDEYWHIVKDGKDLLAGLKATDCYWYKGFCEYINENGHYYLINFNK